MKTKLLKLTTIALLSLSLNASESYSIDELIVKALENSPDIKISSSLYNASKSRLNVASSAYLPSLNFHASVGENGQNDLSSASQNMVSDSLLLGNLSLKQILYDFGKTGSNVESLEYNSNSLKMSDKQKISDKKRDVKVAYYDVLQSIALIKVQEENVKLNAAQLYRAQKYFQAGIRTKIDISDAKVELIKAKIDLKNAQYNLKIAYSILDKEIGFTNTTNSYKVYSKPLEFTTLYSSLSNYSLSLSDSIKFAYKNRYDVKKYEESLKENRSKNSLAKSDYFPALYFGADYTKQVVDEFKNVIPENRWQASINLDWNIYKGGATTALIQESKINIELAQAQLQNTKLSVKQLVTQAFVVVKKTKDSVELSQSLVEVSNEKFKQAAKRYEHGLNDYIELQQSRQGYINSMASLVVEYYSYYQAVAYLDNAIGK